MHTVTIAERISFPVPCEHRYGCYADRLTNLYQQLQQSFTNNPLFNQVLKEPELYAGLAKQLDTLIIYYLNYDFNTHDFGERYAKETAERKRQLYRNFVTGDYQQYTSVPYPNLAEYLHNTFSANGDRPSLQDQLQRLTANYIAVFSELFHRLEQDHSKLMRLYFKELEPRVCFLSKISLSGSDLHKQGRQVLILNYCKSLQQTKQFLGTIVYKPSSVLPDMVFYGNTRALRENGLTTEVKLPGEFQSAAEIINAGLGNLALIAIPTYLIYPREKSQVNESYGYLQYLTHAPWFDTNLADFVSDKYQNFTGSDSFATNIQKEIDRFWSDNLNQATRNNDYLCRSNSQKHRDYSYQCGMLLAMALAFGISDMHAQNLILSQYKPFPIDNEVAFIQGDMSVAATGFFDTYGAFVTSQLPKTQMALADITGFSYLGYSQYEKNLLFDQDSLQPLKPVAAAFKRGMENVLTFIGDNYNLFANWLNSPIIRTMAIRVLPYETSDFNNMLKYISERLFSYAEIMQQARFHIDELYMAAEQVDNIDNRFAIFLPGNFTETMLDLCVPVYYMYINSKQLIDSQGNVVPIDYQRAMRLINLETEIPTHTNYFDSTPSERVLNRLMSLQNATVRNALLDQLPSTNLTQVINEEALVVRLETHRVAEHAGHAHRCCYNL